MARPRSVSDEEVFAAVREAVLQQGPAVSLDVVAERVGVTAPALFRRFGSRQEILLQALRPPDPPPYLPIIEAGPDERPIAQQLTELFTAFGNYMVENLPCMSALRESGMPVSKLHEGYDEPPPLRTVRAFTGWIERAMKKKLLAKGDPASMAMAIMGAVHMPVFVRHLMKSEDEIDVRESAETYTDLFLQGIGFKQPQQNGKAVPVSTKRKERV